MGAEHLNPLGSLKISASITNALLITTRFVHDSSDSALRDAAPLTAPSEAALLTAQLVTGSASTGPESSIPIIMEFHYDG